MKKKTRIGIPLDEWLREALADPAVRKHYEIARQRWLISQAVTTARKRARLTQVQLAKKLRTDQKAIWRLEAGRQNATVEMLSKIAAATNSTLRLELLPRK